MSIRRRLTLWNALAFAAVLVGFAGLVYLLAARALRQQADRTADAGFRLVETDPRLPANPDARLERSFAEVRRFTADASHELRTPLTAIRVEAEGALDRAATAEEYRTLVESVLEECGRMARLTDQLLALAREDAGVAHGVADALRPLAEAKRLVPTADVAPGVVVRGDPIRLRQWR